MGSTVHWWALVDTVMYLDVQKVANFFDRLSEYQLFKNGSAPWIQFTSPFENRILYNLFLTTEQ
jgi:3-methyladenine DNA glycosylase AlkD